MGHHAVERVIGVLDQLPAAGELVQNVAFDIVAQILMRSVRERRGDQAVEPIIRVCRLVRLRVFELARWSTNVQKVWLIKSVRETRANSLRPQIFLLNSYAERALRNLRRRRSRPLASAYAAGSPARSQVANHFSTA